MTNVLHVLIFLLLCAVAAIRWMMPHAVFSDGATIIIVGYGMYWFGFIVGLRKQQTGN